MKYLLITLLAFSAASVFAQEANAVSKHTSSHTDVKESSTDNSYFFSVKVDKQRGQQLIDLYKEITDAKLGGKSTSGFSHLSHGHALVELDPKKRILSVENNDNEPKSIGSAREIADRIRWALGLKETPTSPSPPKH